MISILHHLNIGSRADVQHKPPIPQSYPDLLDVLDEAVVLPKLLPEIPGLHLLLLEVLELPVQNPVLMFYFFIFALPPHFLAQS